MKLDPNGSTASPLTTEQHSFPRKSRFLSAPMRMTAIRYAFPAQQTATPPGNQRIATHPAPPWRNDAHLSNRSGAIMRISSIT